MKVTGGSESTSVVLGSVRCELKKGDDAWIGIVNGKYIRISNSAYYLLRAKNDGITSHEIAEEFTQKNRAKPISADDIDFRYREVVERIRAIGHGSSKVQLPWGYWFRFAIIRQRALELLASPFEVLFRLPVAVLALAVCATLAFAWRVDLGKPITSSGWITAYLLFFVSLIFHEFGHAAASLRFGIKPKDIGFTLYLIYPALYTDVTPIWELGRWKRAVVDIGGCYVQVLVGALYVAGYHFTGYEPLRVGAIVIVYSIAFSMNPVFRFDGYWLLADLLDIPNLSRQPVSVLRYLVSHARRLGRSGSEASQAGGRPRNGKADPSFGQGRVGPTKWLFWVLIIYSALSISVWTRFILHLTPSFRHLLQVTGSLYREASSKSLSLGSWPSITGQLLEMLLLWIMLIAGPARMISRWFPEFGGILKRRVFEAVPWRAAFLRRNSN